MSERIESSPEFQALAEKAVMDLMIHGVSVTEFPPDGTEFIVKGLNE